MATLLNEVGRTDELKAVREDVGLRLSVLKRRLKRLGDFATFSGGAGAVLAVLGIICLMVGTLPENVVLVDASFDSSTASAGAGGRTDEFAPVFQELKSFSESVFVRLLSVAFLVIGIAMGVMRQSLVAFLPSVMLAMVIYQGPHIIESIAGVEGSSDETDSGQVAETGISQQAVDELIAEERWSALSRALGELPDKDKAANMFYAQAVFKAGDSEKAWTIIDEHKLGEAFAEEVWRIETLMDGRSASDDELSESSRVYVADMHKWRERGETMLNAATVPGTLFGISLTLFSLVRRNTKRVSMWHGEGDEARITDNRDGAEI